ncbi:BTAD domain-containing putative transcriptional regulator [Kutzneria buriramensis]|uniref:DNA-binding SARP family transcriptional activator n=1 Tax=Kutzneria buriramensis TaxID=1045776 RepID=A0A3E0HGG6_9PSEU|nr:BTAD domain-containing putative transcriptional regulator [Kutzneria buriramensis]REH44848.1 DNA-binding SARP family transcriptional activator [Kutzneria buriramensis]
MVDGGASLRLLRLAAGLNQRELAARAGISVRAVRYLESGGVTRPRADSLRRLADALGVGVDELVERLGGATEEESSGQTRLRIGVLGPLRVWHDDVERPVPSAMQRLLLSLLAIQAGHTIGVGEIVDLLWSERPPATGAQLVQTYVAQLRRLLEPGPPWRVLRHVGGGYQLAVESDGLDLAECRDLAARARQAWADQAAEPAWQLYREAWSCWRGPVLAGGEPRLLDHPAVAAVTRLRVTIVAEWADVAFALGHPGDVVSALRTVCAEHPLHEGLAARLMVALAGDGQQAAALDVFERLRTCLDEELGVAPGAELRAAHLRVVRGHLPPPSSTSAVTTPRQLPVDASSFVGRHEHLRQLDAVLAAKAPVAVITGMGGIGKTALAVRWGNRVGERFYGGQLYIDLRGHSVDRPLLPREALAHLLRGLGVPANRMPDDEAQAAALYRSQLSQRPVLVVLDNAADTEQVRPLLPGGHGSLALVTSRSELGGLVAREGARLVRLDELTAEEATAVLTETIGVDRVGDEPDAAAELGRLCGRLPLALRIAAANLATSPRLRIGDHVARLAANPLTGLAVKGEASTAVRATFRLSVDVLSAARRRAFRLLGVVPGPDIGTAAVTALLGAPDDLDTLVARHLVAEPSPGRYRMHDLLRSYAAELSEEDVADRDAALLRLAEHYRLRVTDVSDALYPFLLRTPGIRPGGEGFADAAAAFAWMDAEAANVLALVNRLNTVGRHGIAWEIAHLSGGYFAMRMDALGWRSIAEAGGVAAHAGGGAMERAMAELQLGMLSSLPGRAQRSAEHSARAAQLAGEAGWIQCQAVALNNLAGFHWMAGRVDDTIDQLAEALVLHRKARRRAGEAVTLANLGAAHAERARTVGDPAGLRRAKALLDEALTVHRDIGDRRNEAETLRLLAEVHRDLGDLPLARTLAVAALTLARETGDSRTEIGSLSSLGTIEVRVGYTVAGLGHHDQALRLAIAKNEQNLHAQALLDQTDSHIQLGRAESAFFTAHDAIAIGHRTGTWLFAQRARRLLALIPPTGDPADAPPGR